MMREGTLVGNNGYIEHTVPDIGINEINLLPSNFHDTLDISIQDNNQQLQVLFVAQNFYEDNEGYEETIQHKQVLITHDVPIDASNLKQSNSHGYLGVLNASQIVYVQKNHQNVQGDLTARDCFKAYHFFEMFQEKHNLIGRLGITKNHLDF
jgi:hypothetical protein